MDCGSITTKKPELKRIKPITLMGNRMGFGLNGITTELRKRNANSQMASGIAFGHPGIRAATKNYRPHMQLEN